VSCPRSAERPVVRGSSPESADLGTDGHSMVTHRGGRAVLIAAGSAVAEMARASARMAAPRSLASGVWPPRGEPGARAVRSRLITGQPDAPVGVGAATAADSAFLLNKRHGAIVVFQPLVDTRHACPLAQGAAAGDVPGENLDQPQPRRVAARGCPRGRASALFPVTVRAARRVKHLRCGSELRRTAGRSSLGIARVR
jgi:hypothetical protein